MAEITNMLPDFFVVGAAKSGTTSLYHFLDKHPEVYMSPIKEPNHFCTDIKPEFFSNEFKKHEKRKNLDLKEYLSGPMLQKHWGYYVTKREDYVKLYKNRKKEKAAGEVSNSYLYSSEAAGNIRNEIPHAKIIMMLRNPAERAYSHFLANQRDGKTFLPFRNELHLDQEKTPKGWGQSYLYLEMGFYFNQVKRYLDLFPTGQVKIYLYDDFLKDPVSIMKDLFRFIGVNENVALNYQEKYNEAREPLNSRLLFILSHTGIKNKIFSAVPSPLKKRIKALFYSNSKVMPMKKEDREYLNLLFHDDILQLESLIQCDLKRWLK